MHKDFSDDDWADYTYWVAQDKRILKKYTSFLRTLSATDMME